MTNNYCDANCKISRGGAGPWDDQIENYSNIKQAHRDCIGFQIGEPKLKGKANWGHTEIEQLFTDYCKENIHEWFHNLVAPGKGSKKGCLIKDK